ncbi:MAG: hypothetical protein KA100_04415 [Rickettsiales bacterium]|nr:hypothetical protein [Rickettsiales bacterium]
MLQLIDVVIPTHEKDLLTLDHVIAGVKRNVVNVRRIIVVSKAKYTDKAEWFDEALYPFSYKEISDILGGQRVGWHYQQLLKLYASFAIPDISENILILDADTVFYRKVEFFSAAGLPLYNLSKDKDLDQSDFQQTTFKHIVKILPEIGQHFPSKFKDVSGVCHHMLFQRHVLKDLMQRVENADFNGGKFYEVFLKNRESACGVAEYNLYFYFLVSCYPHAYEIRILKYKNTAKFHPWFERLRKKYHYCSYHSYMREEG